MLVTATAVAEEKEDEQEEGEEQSWGAAGAAVDGSLLTRGFLQHIAGEKSAMTCSMLTGLASSLTLYPNLVKQLSPSKRSCAKQAGSSRRHAATNVAAAATPQQQHAAAGGRRRAVASISAALAALLSASNPPAVGAEATGQKKQSVYNIEKARELGERRREDLEANMAPIIDLARGVKYRDIGVGTGPVIKTGDVLDVFYTIYMINGYYLDSVGYGQEGKNDVGDTFKVTVNKGEVPVAVEMGMEGMRVGGKRRIFVPPDLGWVTADVKPIPNTWGGRRRLQRSQRQPLLFEVEIVKARPSSR
eukprot:jgi/Chlat1/6890/Chrsp51S06556